MKYYRAPIVMPLPPPADGNAHGSAIGFISRVVLAAIAVALAAAAIIAAPVTVLRVLGYVMLLGLAVAALTRIAHRLSVPRVGRSDGVATRDHDADGAPDFGMTG